MSPGRTLLPFCVPMKNGRVRPDDRDQVAPLPQARRYRHWCNMVPPLSTKTAAAERPGQTSCRIPIAGFLESGNVSIRHLRKATHFLTGKKSEHLKLIPAPLVAQAQIIIFSVPFQRSDVASYLRDRADVSGLEVSQGFLVVANLSIASNSLMCSSLFRIGEALLGKVVNYFIAFNSCVARNSNATKIAVSSAENMLVLVFSFQNLFSSSFRMKNAHPGSIGVCDDDVRI
ncbi:hypothetical protein OUZ56_016994 [Daphnia magna]|uniref:Uncharacterized protein n=1 Tax=Daphnia magna TaxID=35525 RepID=A0ABR0ASB8_9CRUS|nr:hypothetical protein OUZ56_016994 [Daphnia magna]